MAMRMPAGMDGIRPHPDPSGYGPLGFHAFDCPSIPDDETYGLYWPIGREGEEPIVAEFDVDDRTVIPAFSSLATFLRLAGRRRRGSGIEPPSLRDDPASPFAIVWDSPGGAEPAPTAVDGLVARFPEYTDAVALMRPDVEDPAFVRDWRIRHAIRLALSSPTFATLGRDLRAIGWLAKQEHCPDDVAEDPVWTARKSVARLLRGTTNEAEAHLAFGDAIDFRIDRGDVVGALVAMQTRTCLMSQESRSFRDKIGFDFSEHRRREIEISGRLPNGTRSTPVV